MQNFVSYELQRYTLEDWELEADIKMDLSDIGFEAGRWIKLVNI